MARDKYYLNMNVQAHGEDSRASFWPWGPDNDLLIKVIKSMSQATDSINEVINDLIVFADALKMAKTDDPATDDDEAKMTVSEGLALAQCALEVVSSFSDMLRAMKEDPEAFAEALRSLKTQDETQPPA